MCLFFYQESALYQNTATVLPISLEDFEIRNEIQMSTNNGLCSIIIYNYANLYLALYKKSSFPISHNNNIHIFFLRKYL